MHLFTQIIGFAAATVGTLLMLPQIIKILRTKKVDDISLVMLVLYLVNCLLWLAYGILLVAWPIIVCNIIALVISIFQLILKYIYTAET